MRLISWISAAVVAAVFGGVVHAQMIGDVTANPTTVRAGEPVTVTANVDVVGGNYCGFAVFYGDGKNIESYSDNQKPTPFVTTHVYDKPGTYSISVGGRHVESHPNCGGADKFATVTVTEGARAMMAAPAMSGSAGAMAKPSASGVCQSPWRLVSRSFSARTGAYTCAARAGTALPDPNPVCQGDLTYFENARKGQFGCRP
jgi:hypothetical protein